MKAVITEHPIEKAMSVLGGRWRAILVHTLLDGPKRFTDLQREIGIGRRMLTVNLRLLEEDGLIVRTAYPEIPPRVEYSLTPAGMELRQLIHDLCAWSQKFKDQQKGKSATSPILLPVE